MSYPRDLDEVPMPELKAEIERRKHVYMKGVCTYCGRARGTEPVCKFPKRHNYAGVPWEAGADY